MAWPVEASMWLDPSRACLQLPPTMLKTTLTRSTVVLYAFPPVVFTANGLAAVGKYQAGSVQGAAADKGLFIKDHNY